MPTYCYFCPIHNEFEIQQSINDPPLNECPQCVADFNLEYICNECGAHWLITNNLNNINELTKSDNNCVNCNNSNIKSPINSRFIKPKKLISLTSFVLVGQGWAKDNYSK